MDLFVTEKPSLVMIGLTSENRIWVVPLLIDAYRLQWVQEVAQLQCSTADPLHLPSLFLVGSQMPARDRAELFSQLKCNPDTWNIPVVVVGEPYNDDDELLGFEQGASDFIVPPLRPEIFKAKIRARLAQNSSGNIVRLINEQLETAIAQRTADINTIQDVTIMAMTALAQTRDEETGNHIRRTQHYVRALSLALQRHPRFADFLTDSNIELLYKSAPLHDIGKVGIPDRILLKPGPFDLAEMEIMKSHTTLGRDAIEYAEKLLGRGLDFLSIAKEIAYSHQEKWNGSGYPLGLAGEAIPISARLMAVADVYDAVISRRVYRPGMTHEQAVRLIEEGKGRHFDPDIVDAFSSILDEFQAIAIRYSDSDSDLQKKVDYLELATAANT